MPGTHTAAQGLHDNHGILIMYHSHPMSCSRSSRSRLWRETWLTTRAAAVLAAWFAIAGGAVLAGALAAPPAGAQVAGNQSFVTVVVGHRDGTQA